MTKTVEQKLREEASALRNDLIQARGQAGQFRAERDKALLRLDAALFAMVLMQNVVKRQNEGPIDRVALAT